MIRKTYFLGGQAVATRVESFPAQGGDGFYYLHSDHLGSSSLLTNSSGVKVTGSETRYYPYGSQRLAPSQTITDRNFTGQKEDIFVLSCGIPIALLGEQKDVKLLLSQYPCCGEVFPSHNNTRCGRCPRRATG